MNYKGYFVIYDEIVKVEIDYFLSFVLIVVKFIYWLRDKEL